MPVPTIAAGSVVVCVGDSLTAKGWYLGDDGANHPGSPSLVTLVNQTWNTVRNGRSTSTAKYRIRSVGRNGGRRAAAQNQSKITTWINSGVSGNRIRDIVGTVAARITNYNPDIVFLFVGINDFDGAAPAAEITSPAAFTADYESTIDQILAARPTCKVICMTPMCAGEMWTTINGVNSFSGNAGGNDATIDAGAASIVASAATKGVYSINMRQWAADYEAVNNLSNAATGIITKPADGVHMSVTGALAMCAFVRTQINIGP